MQTLWHDLRYGARMLMKNSGFTLIAVLTLALGIGANTAIFSVVDAVVSRPLPYGDPERLVQVWPVNLNLDAEGGVPYPNFVDWQNRNRVLRGRALTEGDSADATPVVVINETMAQRFWPGEDALGKRIKVGRATREIVGIVGDVKHQRLDADLTAEMYVPYPQNPSRSLDFVVRTAAEPSALAAAARNEFRNIDQDQPISQITTLAQLRSRSVTQPRFNTLLLGLFATIALALAAVGVYGVMSYSITLRTHEIGIRMALGARAGDVLKLVVKQGMALALIGMTLGLTASLALTRLMSDLLFDVRPTDPLTFLAVSLLLTFVVLLAALVPARRATKVDPMVALRCE